MVINYLVVYQMSLANFLIWIDSKWTKTNCQVLYQSHLPTWPMLNTCKWISKSNSPLTHLGAGFLTCTLPFSFLYISSHLNNNSFSGELPSTLSKLSNLMHLWVLSQFFIFLVFQNLHCVQGCISELTLFTSFYGVCLLK